MERPQPFAISLLHSDEMVNWIQAHIRFSDEGYREQRDELFSILQYAKLCESPVESLLFWEFYRWPGFDLLDVVDEPLGSLYLDSFDQSRNEIDVFRLRLQSIIEIEGYDFRVDFQIDTWNTETDRGDNYLIEVDGHDFHEKTKEQAKRDKHRDRLLQKAGYKILRFTGSEVYNDVTGVVREICSHF